MSPDITAPAYHVLLIGIDAYPRGYNSLTGCVNDIDAIEQILLAPPGIGIAPEQIRVTRLAASNPLRLSSSRFQEQTQPPTKANFIQALKDLAGPEVKPEDRVLIYYSGHGDEKLLPGSLVWREALVPHDGQRIEYLYDAEVNALINAITMRTNDLTIILDCCHSAGATRDLSDVSSQGADRHLVGGPHLTNCLIWPRLVCPMSHLREASVRLGFSKVSILIIWSSSPASPMKRPVKEFIRVRNERMEY